MSFEKIAKILCADEVKINHGPKGVAVHVRLNKSWFSAAIDNAELEGRRLEVIAEHLVFLSDANIPGVHAACGGDLRKSRADAATRAALQADRDAQPRASGTYGLSWADVGGFDNPRDGSVQRQLSRSEVAAPPPAPPAELAPDEPAAEAMPSRFHAVMAELRLL